MACHIAGHRNVVSIDLDAHLIASAAVRLAALGYRPRVVTGNGEQGCADFAPYDRVFVSFAVPRIPPMLVEQLAPGGRLLATVGTDSPSWPGLAGITKTGRRYSHAAIPNE
ncbi:protein-L-isoaspartate O-methyltransferase family protein [Streptomyces hayashii]|uniref:protein-L-isoaspartate O-methyltransferase family protein n=1 Tax=Streptomyces hayashii TaxID=2839966 RepID=UPI00403C0484